MSRSSRRLRRSAGFSTMDLLLTLALAGLVLGATVPTASTMVRTYRQNGAARLVLAEIREAQALAVARREVIGFHWGGDADTKMQPDQYRIVRDTTGSCGFPVAGAAQDGQDVLQGWTDLSASFSGMRIDAIEDKNGKAVGGIMFDSLGASLNTCTSVTFPIRVTVTDGSGGAKVIEIQRAGSTRLL